MKCSNVPTMLLSLGGQPGTFITGLFVTLLSAVAFVGFGAAAADAAQCLRRGIL